MLSTAIRDASARKKSGRASVSISVAWTSILAEKEKVSVMFSPAWDSGFRV